MALIGLTTLSCGRIGFDPAPTCFDGMHNGEESAVDCGGNCAACAEGQGCNSNADCVSTFCDTDKVCNAFECGSNANASDHTLAGLGTNEAPFLICTAAQFVSIGHNSSDWSSSYRLIDSIDLSGFDETSYTPIGDAARKFVGTFDGNGNVIDGFIYDDSTASSAVALFGEVKGSRAAIKNIIVTNVNIRGDTHVAALVGLLEHGAVVMNSHSSGTIDGSGTRVGGLVGTVANGAIVSSSSSTATITGNGQRHFGGLVGLMVGGARVTNCYAAGNVDVTTSPLGSAYGGLVGTVQSSILANSFATGNVASNTTQVGGLVGSVEDSGTGIANSFATGNVTCNTTLGDNRCGPIVGLGALSNAYYDSNATCTNTGAGSCTIDGTAVDFLGADGGWFYESDKEPLSNWDFAHTWNVATNDFPTLDPQFLDMVAWGACKDHQSDTLGGGNLGLGTVENPYLICTAEQLQEIGSTPMNWNDKHYKMMDSVDMTAFGIANPYNVIGNATIRFFGSFDGNGMVISNLSITSAADNVGLFGSTEHAIVKNTALDNVAITGNGSVAGIVGHSSFGSILDSYVTGTIIGNTSVGGLLGRCSRSTIQSCYSTARVEGSGQVGGLYGVETSGNANIDNSFAVGPVIGVGGSPPFIGPIRGTGSTTNSSVFDSTATCDQCTNLDGVPKDLQGVDVGWLYNSANSPLDTWDFQNTWQEHPTTFPTLRVLMTTR